MFMISRLFRRTTPRQMTSFSLEKQYFSYCFEKQQQLEKHQKSPRGSCSRKNLGVWVRLPESDFCQSLLPRSRAFWEQLPPPGKFLEQSRSRSQSSTFDEVAEFLQARLQWPGVWRSSNLCRAVCLAVLELATNCISRAHTRVLRLSDEHLYCIQQHQCIVVSNAVYIYIYIALFRRSLICGLHAPPCVQPVCQAEGTRTYIKSTHSGVAPVIAWTSTTNACVLSAYMFPLDTTRGSKPCKIKPR